MVFKPLSYWMQKLNSIYYKKSKPTIYDDFKTYAQSEKGMLSSTNAVSFYNKAREQNAKKYDILEVGVGNGAFAYSFFAKILQLDTKNSTNILSKLNYTFADFSMPTLQNAKKMVYNFSNYCKIKTFKLDASILNPAQMCGELSDTTKGLGNFDLIRCNELFSDIPADMYTNFGGQIMHVLYNSKMQKELVAIKENELDELELKLMSVMPKNYFIPINRLANNSMHFFANKLKKYCQMDIFDYGFYYKSDYAIPADMWNDSIVRDYNAQWTVDLNFIYLTSSFNLSDSITTTIEKQKEYVEKIVGKKVSLKQEYGLDYEINDSGFEEDDSFYYLKIENFNPI